MTLEFCKLNKSHPISLYTFLHWNKMSSMWFDCHAATSNAAWLNHSGVCIRFAHWRCLCYDKFWRFDVSLHSRQEMAALMWQPVYVQSHIPHPVAYSEENHQWRAVAIPFNVQIRMLLFNRLTASEFWMKWRSYRISWCTCCDAKSIYTPVIPFYDYGPRCKSKEKVVSITLTAWQLWGEWNIFADRFR